MDRKCVAVFILIISYSHLVIETEGYITPDQDVSNPTNLKKNADDGSKVPVNFKAEGSNGDQPWPTDLEPDTVSRQVTDTNNGKTIDARATGRAKHWLQTREQTLHMNENGIVKEKNHTPLPWGDTRSIREFIKWPSMPSIPHIPDPEIPQSWKDALGRK